MLKGRDSCHRIPGALGVRGRGRDGQLPGEAGFTEEALFAVGLKV